jgi:hypothetical protein
MRGASASVLSPSTFVPTLRMLGSQEVIPDACTSEVFAIQYPISRACWMGISNGRNHGHGKKPSKASRFLEDELIIAWRHCTVLTVERQLSNVTLSFGKYAANAAISMVCVTDLN